MSYQMVGALLPMELWFGHLVGRSVIHRVLSLAMHRCLYFARLAQLRLRLLSLSPSSLLFSFGFTTRCVAPALPLVMEAKERLGLRRRNLDPVLRCNELGDVAGERVGDGTGSLRRVTTHPLSIT